MSKTNPDKTAKTYAKKISKNYLDMIPVRAADMPWHIMENDMVEVEMENRGFYNTLAQKLFHRPRISHISFDKYGTALWLMIDGEKSIYDIVLCMEDYFPDEKDGMINRVAVFMSILESNQFISTSAL